MFHTPQPPVFGIAGRLALNSKLKRAAGDIAAADELWERSQFAQLERYAATHCNALQHTATHCNALQHTMADEQWERSQVAQLKGYATTCCNALQRAATCCNSPRLLMSSGSAHTLRNLKGTLQRTATHCNTLQRTATH